MKPLLGIVVMVIIIASVGLLAAEYLCSIQIAVISGSVGIGTLLGLFYYAFHTKKIAEGTKENTEVTKANLANIYPAFFFDEACTQSQDAKFIPEVQDDFYIFRFFLVNRKNVPGKIRLDFDFGTKRNKEFISTGPYIFDEKIFEPGKRQFYSIQPHEKIEYKLRIIKNQFAEWIDNVYTDLTKKETTLAHKIGLLVRETRAWKPGNPLPKLYILILLTGVPHPLTRSGAKYEFEKLFYLKFEGTAHTNWKIYGEPTFEE